MEEKSTILKYLNGEMTEKELEAFKQTSEYRFISSLDEELDNFKAPEYNPGDFQFDKAEKKKSIVRFLKPALQIAAVFLIVSSVVFYLMPRPTSLSTSNNETLSFNLPDDSKVFMNAGTQIKYSESDWDSERLVDLSGEAFFEVEKGQKFTVQTGIGNVTVLGTSFNVTNRRDYFRVDCYEGKVMVQSGNQEIILLPGETAQWTSSGFNNWKEALNVSPEWLKGKSTFRSTPYHLVLDEFERQFDVSLRTKKINKERLFTGSFDHEHMEAALRSITVPFNISYNIEGKKILLFKQDSN